MRLAPLVLALATLPIAGGCGQACPAALLTGTLVREGGELVVAPNVGGSIAAERVVWPAWHRLETRDGILVVIDAFGTEKAREGDVVRLGGGERGAGTWGVCGVLEVASAAPS